MNDFWPDEFPEDSQASPKQVFEQLCSPLDMKTKGAVYGEIVKLEPIDALSERVSGEFPYRFDLVGRYLNGYRFRVLSFVHDITLYPVKFMLDEYLWKEMFPGTPIANAPQFVVKDENELKNFLGIVFRSKRVTSVVASIIKLSR